jgi:hypothetical protein
VERTKFNYFSLSRIQMMKNRVAFVEVLLPLMILIIIGISACNVLPTTSIQDQKETLLLTFETISSDLNFTKTPPIEITQFEVNTVSPSVTPSPTNNPTPTNTPNKLANFSYDFRPNEVSAQTYLDTCEYLANRWGEGKSKPGTIVVPVMYHSVRKSGRPLLDNMQVSQEYFEYTMDYAEKMGFETITTEELIGFLYNNAPIPQLSMILIIDDRRLGVVKEHFMKYLDENDWTVTLAYITGVATDFEWREFDRLNIDNRLDLQAHGFLHNGETYITEFTSVDVIEEELYAPISIIEEHAGRRPSAFIWPGGNFTTESVQMAREAEYEIGFTVYSRGPLMYNWIPLGAEEKKVQDPLLVLPRFWSSSAAINLEKAVEISIQAQEFAEDNKAKEKIWFENYCLNDQHNVGED